MEPWVWGIIIAAFLILECVTCELVSIWFAAGSVAGLILSLIPGVSIWAELLTSLAVTILLLVFTRSFVKKWLETKGSKTNVDALVGKSVELLTDIASGKNGTVKISGTVWNAFCEKTIKTGRWVTIVKVEGNKLFVEETSRTHAEI